MGIEVRRGDPAENVPGKTIVIPEKADQMRVEDFDMEKIRLSYITNAIKMAVGYEPTSQDERFLAEDSKSTPDFVREAIGSMYIKTAGMT